MNPHAARSPASDGLHAIEKAHVTQEWQRTRRETMSAGLVSIGPAAFEEHHPPTTLGKAASDQCASRPAADDRRINPLSHAMRVAGTRARDDLLLRTRRTNGCKVESASVIEWHRDPEDDIHQRARERC